jgi:ABC-type branched-subunit amino acid transport system substrate-binding protein
LAKVDYYALFAFDATWALIQALQQLCSLTINISSSCISTNMSSFCFSSRFINSELLLDIISATAFLGVSGPVQFSTNVTDRVNGSDYYT